jgi:hypothetical protein
MLKWLWFIVWIVYELDCITSFSRFWRYHILTRIFVRPYNTQNWYIRRKKFDYHIFLILRQKILMTRYQDIMIKWFVCQCTRDTNFPKINYIVINILNFQSPAISTSIISSKLSYTNFFSTYVVLFALKHFHQYAKLAPSSPVCNS